MHCGGAQVQLNESVQALGDGHEDAVRCRAHLARLVQGRDAAESARLHGQARQLAHRHRAPAPDPATQYCAAGGG